MTDALDRWGRAPLDPYQDGFFAAVCRSWFRVEWEGLEHVPRAGGALLVSNHAGMMPIDGGVIQYGIESQVERQVYLLAHHGFFRVPFVGRLMNRSGTVVAHPDNAHRLLREDGHLVLVFPEGEKGPVKPPAERYRLQRFGRGGFIRLCLRTNTPIIPCAVVGAEEANPTVYRVESLAKLVGLPYLPVTPTFPALGPLGLLPAPTKWKIRFGEPMRFTHYGPEAADDDLLVMRLTEGVRTVIQEMLSGMLAKRRSIWLG